MSDMTNWKIAEDEDNEDDELKVTMNQVMVNYPSLLIKASEGNDEALDELVSIRESYDGDDVANTGFAPIVWDSIMMGLDHHHCKEQIKSAARDRGVPEPEITYGADSNGENEVVAKYYATWEVEEDGDIRTYGFETGVSILGPTAEDRWEDYRPHYDIMIDELMRSMVRREEFPYDDEEWEETKRLIEEQESE